MSIALDCLELLNSPSSAATINARVLHLINGEHYSGAERVQDLLACSLGEFGYQVGFACLKPGKFAAVRRSQDAPLFDVPMRGRFDLSPVARLVRLVKRERFSLLHAHTPRAALVGRIVASITGVPLVYHLHSPTAADSTHKIRNRANAAVERLSLRGAAGVIAVSHSLGDYARARSIPEKRLWVVPNGVPIRGPLDDRQPPQGAWTLGTVALFRPRKGVEVLIESLAILRAKGLPVRLRAVGAFETAEYEQQIKRDVERSNLADAIDWVGFTTDVAAEWPRMDLFVLPSLFGEGLPMVVLEAMAAGVPVVATRVEGVPEAIRDGVDGLLVEPSDPLSLSQAVADVVTGAADWWSLREHAHYRQAQLFSDRSMAQGVASVYRQVLAR
jgi:glycosyltransferase involved in cell wall biosynthesis